MKRDNRRSNREQARTLKRRVLLDFDRLEVRQLLSMTFTVNNTNATGSGSLEDAITQSNLTTSSSSDPNAIQFDISGAGAKTITLTQQLPDITQPTDIQGYTQPGASANTNPLTMGDNAVLTVIVSGGESMTNNGLIFDASAAGSSVEGLDLVGFTGGIAISINSDNTSATGNFIGVGTNGVPTSSTVNFDGVIVNGASGDTIGGTVAADRNVITGNTFEAVTIGPIGEVYASNDAIEGNFIGPDADLTLPTDPSLVNDFGVLSYPSAGNTIGGTASGAGNVISGNAMYGVGTQDSLGLVMAGDVIQDNGVVGVLLISSPGASITSSTIGGTTAGQGNLSYGIYLENSTNATIGGTTSGTGDLIADNGATGVTADNTSTGTEVAGSTITGNTDYGINFAGQSGSSLSGESLVDDLIQANPGGGVRIAYAPGTTLSSSTIGGATSVLGNLGFGVSVVGSANVSITGTILSDNTADGIDISSSTGAILASDTIQSNGGHGILLTSSNLASITSSTIGGTTAGLGNATGGISLVASPGVTIGGTLAAASDAISGNTGPGVHFDATSTGGLVAGSTISSNTGTGIAFAGTSGSMLSGEVVVGDLIQANLAGGVLITDAPGTSVSSSTIGGGTALLGNSSFGVEVDGSANVTLGGTGLAGLSVLNNTGPGIAITAASTGSNVLGSTISGQTGDGVDVTSSNSVTLAGDTVRSNSGHGVFVTTSSGFSIGTSTIGGTTAGQGNSVAGVLLISSTGATIGGMVSGNSGDGVYFGATSTGGLVTNATISGNTGAGISFNGVTGSMLSGESVVGDLIQANLVGGVLITDAPGTSVKSSTIGGATVLLGNGSFGVEVSGSANVTLGGAGQAGLQVLDNGGVGIAITANSTDANVLGSTISGSTNDGIDVIVSNGAVLTGDTVEASAMGSGVSLTNSSGVLITSSTIGGTLPGQGNNGVGINLVGSPGVSIGGTIAGSGDLIEGNVGDGVDFDPASASGLVAGSTISGNTGRGVSFDGTSGTSLFEMVLVGDLIQANMAGGILITDAPGTSVTSSTIGGAAGQGNGTFGISVSGSPSLVIQGSTVSDNSVDGIDLSSSPSTILTGDIVQSNGGIGVLVATSSGSSIISSTIGGSIATGNDAGISVQSSAGVTIGGTLADNLVVGNAGDGIDFDDASPNGLVVGSTISDNMGVGVSFNGMTLSSLAGESLSGDLIQANGAGGVVISDAPNTSVTSSTIGGATAPLGNLGDGILVVGSIDVTIGGTAAGAGVLIESNTSGGINFDSLSSGGQVTGSTISGNTGVGISFDGITGSSLSGEILIADVIQSNGGDGVVITDAPDTTVTSSTIGGVTAPLGNNGGGILVSGSANITLGGTGLAGLSVLSNNGPGIAITATSPNAQVLGSTISDNTGDGVDVTNSNAFVLNGDLVQSNTGSGVLLTTSSGDYLPSNTIGGTSAGQGNGSTGIFLVGSTDATIGGTMLGTGDLIAGNAVDGIDFDATSIRGLVATSTISGNTGVGISFLGTSGSPLSGETLTGDTVLSNTLGGILVNDAPGTSITGTTIGGTATGQGNGGYGVSVNGSANVTIGGSDIGEGVMVLDNTGVGVAIDPSNNAQLINSTIAGNTGVGVDVVGSTGSIMTGDLIESNQAGGVLLSDAGEASISTSTIGGTTYALGNGLFGISVVGSNSVVLGGPSANFGLLVQDNQDAGISLDDSSGVMIEDSTAVGNTGVGLTALDSPMVGISGNTIVMNAQGGIFLNNSSLVIGSGNTVSPAPTTSFTVSGGISEVAGQVETITVTAYNAYGNVDTGYDGTVHFTSSDGQAVLPADSTLTDGVGTFQVTLKTAGQQSITATDTSLPEIAGNDSDLLITPAAASHFVIAGAMSGPAGQIQTLNVTAYDPYGNVATGYVGTVHFTSSDGQAVLPADSTLTDGLGTFQVTLKTAGPQSISVVDTNNLGISGSVSGLLVSPGPASIFTIATVAAHGYALTITVSALDSFGNLATGYAGTIHFASSDDQATLPANSTLSDGVGTFVVTFSTSGMPSVTVTDTIDLGLTDTQVVDVDPRITGTVYLDFNANGQRDSGEPGMAGRVVFLDLNHDGTLDLGDPTATTDANGNFSLSGVAAGTGGVLEATSEDSSDRWVVDQTTTNAQGIVSIGVVPISPVAPVPVIPNPFSTNPSSDPNTAYVQSLYKAVLGRTGADSEVATWLVKMTDGMTQQQVAEGFVNSQEHRQDEVEAYYEEFLHRAPDPGSVVWVNDLLAGVSEEKVVEGILDSPEYEAANEDSTLFIDDLYNDVLGREGDAAGVAGWLSALASGTSRDSIVASFVQSTEAIDQVVESFYTAYLHRQPEQLTSNIWVTMLEQPDGSATDVAIGILASPEFDTDATTSQQS